ncbi:hypothetical protein PVK06_017652 [Gossypium arboreum]|uniref:Uncharacterized protein n=1 Tax=Gossypium arboreum TaxID=29729 RepID=A0ABR0Q466_GOSAR|nr:hypothetical protein PVK06_017652 [Gossypium arboreum]
MIIPSYEKLKVVLDNKCLLANQAKIRAHLKEFDEVARHYMLVSVTNTLFKLPEIYDSAKVILDKLEDMFGGQVSLARQSAIISLMNAQQKHVTSVKKPNDYSYKLLCRGQG